MATNDKARIISRNGIGILATCTLRARLPEMPSDETVFEGSIPSGSFLFDVTEVNDPNSPFEESQLYEATAKRGEAWKFRKMKS